MTCFHPVDGYVAANGGWTADRRKSPLAIKMTRACGGCIGCRLRHAGDWATRLVLESKFHEESWALTLTYDDDHLPENYSFSIPDAQLFHRLWRQDLRRKAKREGRDAERLRFHLVTDFGDHSEAALTPFRPHAHAHYFGVSIPDMVPVKMSRGGFPLYESPTLSRLWGKGFVNFSRLTPKTAAYAARHNLRKVSGPAAAEFYHRLNPVTGEFVDCEPERMICSLKPGLAGAWFGKFASDVFPSDCLHLNGQEVPVPRYFDRQLKGKFNVPGSKEVFVETRFGPEFSKRLSRDDFHDVRVARALAAKTPHQVWNNSPERLAVREEVANLRDALLKREL